MKNGKALVFKIEKGKPIPPAGSRWGKPKYPFKEMKAGDSFAHPERKARSLLYGLARYHGVKIRICDEGDGLRIWRVS
jgi:hypothetical protein